MIGITKLRIFTSLIVSTCLAVSGCRTTSDPDPLLGKIPVNDAAVMLIQDPDQVLIDLMRWLERALGPAGRTISDRLRHQSQRIVGFDPATSKLSDKLNLNNDVGFGVFSPAEGLEPLLIAKTTKPKALIETLFNWYRRIDASAKVESRTNPHSKLTLHYFGKPFGKDLNTTFIVRELDDGWFILGSGESEASLSAYRVPSRNSSLATHGVFSKSSESSKADIHIWAPPALLFGKTQSPLNQRSRGVLSSIDISPKGLQFVTEAPIELPSFLQAMQTAPLGNLLALSGDDNFFVAATRLAQLNTLNALAAHPPWQNDLINVLREATEKTGLDIQQDVIPQLNGDVLITAALAPDANLRSLRQLTHQRSLSTLGSQFRGRIYLGVKDPKAMRNLLLKGLEKLREGGQALNQRSTEQGYLIIEPALTEPAFGWAVGQSHYVYSLGAGELEHALKAIESSNSSSLLSTQYGTRPNTTIGLLRLGVLSRALKSMTTNGGLPPQLKGLVQPAISALERIGDISLSLEFTDSSVRLSLTETLP